MLPLLSLPLPAVLQPGYFAANISANGTITAAGVCPQGFICHGGKPNKVYELGATQITTILETTLSDPTVSQCPYGTLTKELGSTTMEQCLTPPGHFTDIAEQRTVKCPPGSYRAGWRRAEQATSCVSCGEGVSAEATGRVTLYTLTQGLGSNEPLEMAVCDTEQSCCKWSGGCKGGWVGQRATRLQMTSRTRSFVCCETAFGQMH
jgi:hypothetical protein